jgi:putative ABC transport system ATP-binding protein
MSPEAEPMLIRMKEISKVYRVGARELSVLRSIDLEISAGEFVAIMGKSGSGKSTLLYLLGCLDLPTSGVYELNGTCVTDLSDRELSVTRNTRIGFVFQTFNLISQLTVLENVELPLHYGGVPASERQKRSLALIEKVGLLGRSHHTPVQLSGGEMQRVAIARALVNDPQLIVADEPTGNLDTGTSREIMQILAELNRQGRTIIMVTHDPHVAAYAKRTLQLHDGALEVQPERR